MVSVLYFSVGFKDVSPLVTVSTGSIEKGLVQYWENMVTRVSNTIFPLVRSVHVHSMNTFLVLRVIFECSLLMMGGRERTTLLAS